MNVTMRTHSSAPTSTSIFLFSRNFIGKIPTSSIPSPEDPNEARAADNKMSAIALFFSFFGKISGIFHYFNESFVIDPLNDFGRHFTWLSKTSLLLKIGQSP